MSQKKKNICEWQGTQKMFGNQSDIWIQIQSDRTIIKLWIVMCYYCIVYVRVINVFVVSSCILVSRINKLKKWLFYIYLLTTITKALYQSSEKGMSLLFTCPQLTAEESSLLVAAMCCMLHMLCNFYQIESIPQFLELWFTLNAF